MPNQFAAKVDEVAGMVKQKNLAYGNSFGTAKEALKILYPGGIRPEQYGTSLLLARIWDKLKRLSTDNDPYGESPFIDIAGYAICGATLDTRDFTDQNNSTGLGHSNMARSATGLGAVQSTR